METGQAAGDAFTKFIVTKLRIIDPKRRGPFPIGSQVEAIRPPDFAREERTKLRRIAVASTYMKHHVQYVVEGYTKSGGVVLKNFLLPVSAKDLRLVGNV